MRQNTWLPTFHEELLWLKKNPLDNELAGKIRYLAKHLSDGGQIGAEHNWVVEKFTHSPNLVPDRLGGFRATTMKNFAARASAGGHAAVAQR